MHLSFMHSNVQCKLIPNSWWMFMIHWCRPARIFVQTWFSAGKRHVNDRPRYSYGILASNLLASTRMSSPNFSASKSWRYSQTWHINEIYTSFAFACWYLIIFVMYSMLTGYLYPSGAQMAWRCAETTLW